MASALSNKSPCSSCGNKGFGIFKCEGCLQTFCRKHSSEHRDLLLHQLEEVITEHDVLQQMIIEQKEKQSDYHRFAEQINEWESISIMKIQKAAIEARQQTENLVARQNSNIVKLIQISFVFIGIHVGTISSKLSDLGEEVRKAREDEDFFETDLRLWTTKSEELKTDITDI